MVSDLIVPAMSPPHITAASLLELDVHDEEEYKQFIIEGSLPEQRKLEYTDCIDLGLNFVPLVAVE